MYVFQNLNQSLIGMSKELLSHGVKRKTRGFDCTEMPTPVLICIENPSDRHVTIPERKWNKYLPYVESLWIALGLNDLDAFPGHYVKSLYNFSDDGHSWRAGYGPRIRACSGISHDYFISDPKHRHIQSGNSKVVDQLDYVIKAFQRDINTRQAIIEIGDPAKDCFKGGELKVTKDFPCTRSLHLQVNTNGEMDMIVDLRSNDALWGFSAVNVFNFTLLQEYIANIVGVPVGRYFHKADNFHFYENFRDKIEEFAAMNIEDYPTGERFFYSDKIESLREFDDLLETLLKYENVLRGGNNVNITIFNDMFNDWAKVIKNFWYKEEAVTFKNPYLNEMFKK